MYSASEISKHIIFYSNKNLYCSSNLKLQKELCFLQLYFIRITGHPCFSDPIEAWEFGPVVPEIYRKYSWVLLSDIPIFSDPHVCFKKGPDRKIVEQVVDLLAPYTNSQLLTMIRKQPPFKNTYSPAESRVIPISEMEAFAGKKEGRKKRPVLEKIFRKIFKFKC